MDRRNYFSYGSPCMARGLRHFPRLPVPVQPLEEGDLRYTLEQSVSDGGHTFGHTFDEKNGDGVGVRRELQRMQRSASAKQEDEEMPPADPPPPTEPSVQEKGALASALQQYLPSALFCRGNETRGASSVRPEPPCEWNAVELLLGREVGVGRTSRKPLVYSAPYCAALADHWTMAQKRGAICPSQIPSVEKQTIDRRSRHAYIGRFSDEGDLFVAGYQDQRIFIYEPGQDWKLRKLITARMLRWTITDTCISHDSRFLLYSTISPVVHIVKLDADGIVDSQANITEIHAPVYVGEEETDMFGIWSMAWSKSGKELVVGTNADQDNILLYDMEQQCTTDAVSGHVVDVNAVAFLDASCQVFVSGSDDATVKVWDRRILGQGDSACGTLVGHLEGVTHIDSKGDGRYLISNCKDQTIKLWDVRKMVSDERANEYRRLKNSTLPQFLWDYRWNEYPGKGYLLEHPQDGSLMTFRGHSVLQTLIRAYFSPEFTTGQRYIYSGCRTGTVHIFDILTGEKIKELTEHRDVVRDCSWHPYEPSLVSTSWDGDLIEWGPRSG